MTRFKKWSWQNYVLVCILLLSFFLNFWALAKEGYSNPYYSAAVKSMLANPSAFFFGSFDSGLYVTVDKPAAGLWLQALSAKIFGINSFGLIFPCALAGCLSVLMMYLIMRKKWGRTAGIIAAAIVAATPILVALSRTNNLDMLLLFFLLCGAYVILTAYEKQSLPLYMLAMVFIGIGFNIKMLQAFMAVPAFVLIYLLGKGRFLKKLLHTAIALIVLAVVSLSWAVIVDAIPASERPYVGGSETNSVIELALGYNGAERLLGQQAGGGAERQNNMSPDGQAIQNGYGGRPDGSISDGVPGYSGTSAPGNGGSDGRSFSGGPGGAGGGVGGDSENGTKGVLRLYSTQLSGLISWFLFPALCMVALAAAGAVYWVLKRKKLTWSQEDKEKLCHMLFWSAWLIPMAGFFSIAGFMHRYYVVMLCPAIGALAAVAFTMAWKSSHKNFLVPLCVLATLAVQCVIVARSSWSWLQIPMLAAGIAGVLLYRFGHKLAQTAAAVLISLALFAAPLAWSFTPVFGTLNAQIPNAGPNADMSSGARTDTANSELIEYITANYNGERWALAVSNANMAAPIILKTGLPVMSIGGFSGSDQILTVDALKAYVASGDLRFYLMTSDSGNNTIAQWIQENATAAGTYNGFTLYDLTGAK